MQWSIEIAGSGSELKEFMCALVQHFHCPLSSNIISGVLKSFNSEELQREQWTVSSEQWRITATVIHEESSSVCGQGELQWCLRVFYSPFWRRISTRIAYVIVDNPTSSFDLHTTFTQVSSFSQWGLHGSSFPKSSFGCALLQMIRLPFGDVQSCFVQPRITGVHLWSLPIIYVVILIFSRAIPTWLPSFVSSLPLSFMYI